MNKLEILRGQIEDILNGNSDVLWQTVEEINNYNEELDYLKYYQNDEEFFDTFFANKPMDAVRAVQYGEYNYCDDYVKFDGYGNLESISECELTTKMQDSIEEIIDAIMEYHESLDLDGDIENLLNEYFESEEN